MACPKSFFDFDAAYFRLGEVVCISREGSSLVVELRGGRTFTHRDHNGSAAKLESRLLDAILWAEL